MSPRTTVPAVIAIAMLMSMFPYGSTAAQTVVSGRWDLRMIDEAQIWTHLLTGYVNADHQRAWPQRKSALQLILSRYPDSRWADDAALTLACGRASLENDLPGAIADLERIAEQYPDAQTVIDRWDPDLGCRFDETWLARLGGLVSIDPEGTIRKTRPFDRDGEIDHREQEALRYFSHLARYPRSTRAMARLLGSHLLLAQGDAPRAVAMLESMVEDADAYLSALNRTDRIAVSRDDGFLCRNLFGRPEYHAYLMLAQEYQRQGKTEATLKSASTLVQRYSSDGWLWWINREVADLYRNAGRSDLADEQYSLTLKGLDTDRKLSTVRANRVGSKISPAFWTAARAKIEEQQHKLKLEGSQQEE